MNNATLYVITVLIWGTTWYAIKMQVDHAPLALSILYRAVLASVFLLILCKYKKYSLRFSLKNHFYLALSGLSMFSLHHICVYGATLHIVSGIVAIVFSGVSFLSILNNFIFFGVRPVWNLVLGALIGVIGVFLFFMHDMMTLSFAGDALTGLGLACLGALIFSLGSVVTKRNNQQGLQIIPALTFGMIYGSIVLFFYTMIQGVALTLPTSALFWASLLYLVVPGSIVAFFCYMKLIKTIGPERASFATVLFPVVALLVSAVFEGYRFSPNDALGLGCVLLGNLLVLKKRA
jgi:drug/metabolite transporter (DMT)-like permease